MRPLEFLCITVLMLMSFAGSVFAQEDISGCRARAVPSEAAFAYEQSYTDRASGFSNHYPAGNPLTHFATAPGRDSSHTVQGVTIFEDSKPNFAALFACGGRYAYIRLSSNFRPSNETQYFENWGQARYFRFAVGPYHDFRFTAGPTYEGRTPSSNLECVNRTRDANGRAHSNRNVLCLGQFYALADAGLREELRERALAASRAQAQLFSLRLRQVLLAEPPDSEISPRRGFGFVLPIMLSVTDQPLIGLDPTESQREAVNALYHDLICEWFIHVATRNWLKNPDFFLLHTNADVAESFRLDQLSCRYPSGAPIRIAISLHVYLPGSAGVDAILHQQVEVPAGTTDEERSHIEQIERETQNLCIDPQGQDICMFEQYTSQGDFGVFNASSGNTEVRSHLLLERYRGSPEELMGQLWEPLERDVQ